MKSTVRRIIPILVMLVSGQLSSHASAVNFVDEPFATISISQNNSYHPIIELTFNAVQASAFSVTVKDATGYILYTDTFSATNLVKKYKLDAEDAGMIDGTTFEIINLGTRERQNFVINNKETFSSKLEVVAAN